MKSSGTNPPPQPYSGADRLTEAHEMIYFLTKSKKYFYNHMAIRTSLKEAERILREASKGMDKKYEEIKGSYHEHSGIMEKQKGAMLHLVEKGANLRNVWTIPFEPTTYKHFAPFPSEIPRRAILLGCPPKGVVFDPFTGSGTTLLTALALGRQPLGCDINPDYVALAEKRLNNPSEIDRLLGIWDRKEDTVITGDKPVGLDVIQWTLL